MYLLCERLTEPVGCKNVSECVNESISNAKTEHLLFWRVVFGAKFFGCCLGVWRVCGCCYCAHASARSASVHSLESTPPLERMMALAWRTESLFF